MKNILNPSILHAAISVSLFLFLFAFAVVVAATVAVLCHKFYICSINKIAL